MSISHDKRKNARNDVSYLKHIYQSSCGFFLNSSYASRLKIDISVSFSNVSVRVKSILNTIFF